MYKFKHAFWHGREGKSELMLSFTSCGVGELGMATPIQMHPLYVSCDTLWLTLVIRSSGTPAWDWLAALPRHSRASKVDSQHSGQSPQSGVLHCHTDTAFTHTLLLLHPENQTSYKNLSVRFKPVRLHVIIFIASGLSGPETLTTKIHIHSCFEKFCYHSVTSAALLALTPVES